MELDTNMKQGTRDSQRSIYLQEKCTRWKEIWIEGVCWNNLAKLVSVVITLWCMAAKKKECQITQNGASDISQETKADGVNCSLFHSVSKLLQV